MQKKILIIEDDDAIRESLVDLLELFGHKTLMSSNGQEGINLLNSCAELPGLILVDLMMPVMDGYQFCEELSRVEHLKDIPVVIMSAHGQVKEKTIAAAFLRKPVDISEITKLIDKFYK